ncbi:MAG: FHA domain-containing protein [Planctomycetota bacterium]
MNVTLVVKKGELAGREFPIAAGETVIGRSPKVTIPITADTKSSRRHARFMLADGALGVADMGSANGTLVNGSKIDGEVKLFDGDKVLVGSTLFIVKAPGLSRLEMTTDAPPPPAAPAAPAAPASKKPTDVRRSTPSAPAPAATPAKPAGPAPDALALEETRPLVLDDGTPVAPAASRPASSLDDDGDLGEELELTFDESGKPASLVEDAAMSPADKARAKARERAAALAAAGADADAVVVRKPAHDADDDNLPAPAPAGKKSARKRSENGTVDWAAGQREILRARGGDRPNLVQRLLGDLGPITSDFGSQPVHIQAVVVFVALIVIGGMFMLGLWIFGGCAPDNRVRPLGSAPVQRPAEKAHAPASPFVSVIDPALTI